MVPALQGDAPSAAGETFRLEQGRAGTRARQGCAACLTSLVSRVPTNEPDSPIGRSPRHQGDGAGQGPCIHPGSTGAHTVTEMDRENSQNSSFDTLDMAAITRT